MLITIEEARKLIGEGHTKYSDEQIEEIINTLYVISDLAIDSWISKTPEERKKFAQQLKIEAKNRNKP